MKKHVLLITTLLFSSTYCADQSADGSQARKEIRDRAEAIIILNLLIERLQENAYTNPAKAEEYIQRINGIKDTIKRETPKG